MKKLRNKKTGEIREIKEILIDGMFSVGSLAELNEEWEDYEESKEHWCINEFGTPEMAGRFNRESIYDKSRKLIGNDFESKEEAEKAVEKLKAWKRLEDKGFEFECAGKYENLCGNGFEIPIRAIMPPENYTDIEVVKDLDLLFGGEE